MLGSVPAERIYDAISDRYDRWTESLDNMVFNRMRRSLLSTARGHVLEVAIGSGKNFPYYDAECQLIGLDASARMLTVATARARRRGIAFEAHHGNAASLPFDTARFDTVVCTLAGCTFEDPVAVYREMRRVCRPGGHVLFLEHVRPPTAYLRGVLRLAAPLTTRALGCDPDRDTVQLIERAGLNIASCETAARGILVGLTAER